MNRSGAPANCLLLCMIYVCYILNHIACGALNGSIPLLVLYVITPDISIMLLYTFYQHVFYATHDQHFPSESEERASFWVGFGEHCRDAMTHKLLDKITQKIIYRSAVRPLTKWNKVEELITYNQLLDHLEQADEQDNYMNQEHYRFRAIIGHEGPLKATDPNWKGSKWNDQIE